MTATSPNPAFAVQRLVRYLVSSKWAGGGTIVALVVAVYANSLDNGFQYDDLHSIVKNHHLHSLSNVPVYFSDPGMFSRDADKAMYRPLVLTTLALNYAWGELRVGSYHGVNVLLHAACAVLVWLILLRLQRPACMALLGGLLFAVHPLCTEPVNYISSRSELQAAVGVLGAFWMYCAVGIARSSRWLIGSLSFFAIGLLSKSVAIVLPVLLIIYEAYRGNLQAGTARRLVPYFLLAAGYAVVVSSFLHKAVFDQPVRSLTVQWATQVKAAVYYAKLLLMPTTLNVHHSFWEGQPGDGSVLICLLLCLAGVGCLLQVGVRGSTLFLGMGWIAVTLAPASIVPLNVLVNEHRLYLPLAGFILLFTGISRLERVPGLLWLVLGMLLIMAVVSGQRNRDWENEFTLWQAAAARAPEEVRAYVYMGNYLREVGNPKGAVVQYERALELDPENGAAANNLGNAYRQMGEWQRAVEIYENLNRRNPDLVDVRYNLARSLQDGGETDRALSLYLNVDRSSFHFDLALNNAGTIYEQGGRLDSALAYYGRALVAKPGARQAGANWQRISRDFEHHAIRLHKQRDFEQLESAARLLLRRERRHRGGLFWLAGSLFGQRRYSDSILHAQQLVGYYPDFGPGYLELARGLETSGRSDEALQAYRDLLASRADTSSKAEGNRRMSHLLEAVE